MKIGTLLFLLMSFHLLPLMGQPAANSTALNKDIDAYVNDVMATFGIPGVALAVIKDGTVAHKQYYGYANLEHRVPMSEESIFRVYSLTKPVVSVGVFQLIEQGTLRLEDRVSLYVPSLPDSWNTRQIKHLLSHSSGLPDIPSFPEIQNLSASEATSLAFAGSITAVPGATYAYNQSNFWLIQEIIEHVQEEPLEDFILSNQFGVSPDTAFFSADSRDIVQHRVTPYFPFTKGHITIDHPYTQGDYTFAMNGLNITLNEFIRWHKKLMSDALIQPMTRQKMWQPFPYSQSPKRFAYGWDKHVVDGRESVGFFGKPGNSLPHISSGGTLYYFSGQWAWQLF